MKINKVFLYLSLAIFMVFSLSFVTSSSFAYWTAGVAGDISDTASTTVSTGNWAQAFPWDETATYVVGDLVTHNGSTYSVKKDNPTREPGVDKGWKSQWNLV